MPRKQVLIKFKKNKKKVQAGGGTLEDQEELYFKS